MYTDSRPRTEALVDAVDDLVSAWPGVSRKTMFGCPSYVADGVLFAVVSEQGLSLTRLTDDQRAALAATHAVEPFDAGGHSVRKWATVDIDSPDEAAVVRALTRSYEAAIV